MSRAPRVAVAAALGLGLAVAHAEVVDLTWTPDGRFERDLRIAPGKFAELCGPLQAGQNVRWSFEADRPLNFNIHYHVGQDVHYPAKQEQVRRSRGDLVVEAPQDYCWMWVNKTGASARLSVELVRP